MGKSELRNRKGQYIQHRILHCCSVEHKIGLKFDAARTEGSFHSGLINMKGLEFRIVALSTNSCMSEDPEIL